MYIKKLLPKIKKNILLKNHTTFKIGGPAKYFYIAKRKEDLIGAIKVAKKLKLPFIVLGEGSNVLFSDRGYKGLVIKFQARSSKFQNSNVYVEAGVKLNELVESAAKGSLTGLGWAAGIPGTVGGAVRGNAGAFGSVIADAIKRVEVFDAKTLRVKNLSRKDCKFSSKDTVFKHRKNLIILSVVFKLKKGNKKEIQRKINEYLNYRRKNHPLDFPSAGCVFKNPEIKIPARGGSAFGGKNKNLLKEFPELKEFNKKGIIPSAYLIEKCGLKGKKLGQAKFSENHANFIINLGKAKTKDVLSLINLAKQKIKSKFGIILEEEIEKIL